jgi:outer membrane protein assembly factor BamB
MSSWFALQYFFAAAKMRKIRNKPDGIHFLLFLCGKLNVFQLRDCSVKENCDEKPDDRSSMCIVGSQYPALMKRLCAIIAWVATAGLHHAALAAEEPSAGTERSGIRETTPISPPSVPAGSSNGLHPKSKSLAREDWPQLHGPRRDNKSIDTGLMKKWPEGGPGMVWSARGIGKGYAGAAIVDGRLYTAGDMDGKTVVSALDDRTGNLIWQTENGKGYTGSFPGARVVPTHNDGRLYHLGGGGDIACIDAQSGKKLWTRNIVDEFGCRLSRWGLVDAPLVDGDRVVFCIGAPDVALAAFDKRTGKTVWKTTGVDAVRGYSAPILVDYRGLRQIILPMAAVVVGVAADTGRLLWTYDYPVSLGAMVNEPVYREGRIVLSAVFRIELTMLQLDVDGENCSVSEVWKVKELDNEMGCNILVDGYLYGLADNDHRQRYWACVEWETGKTMYRHNVMPNQRFGAITYADGMLYVLNDRGTVDLVPATPAGFKPVSQFELPDRKGNDYWAHPIVCNGRLYLRHDDRIYAYDIREK